MWENTRRYVCRFGMQSHRVARRAPSELVVFLNLVVGTPFRLKFLNFKTFSKTMLACSVLFNRNKYYRRLRAGFLRSDPPPLPPSPTTTPGRLRSRGPAWVPRCVPCSGPVGSRRVPPGPVRSCKLRPPRWVQLGPAGPRLGPAGPRESWSSPIGSRRS